MALPRTAAPGTVCIRSRTVPFVSFTTARPLTIRAQGPYVCQCSEGREYSTSDNQTTASSSPESSSALLLARNALQTAGTCTRELLTDPCSLVAIAALVLYLAPTQPAIAADAAQHHQQLYTIAEGEDFWTNVARYARYFVTVLLGTGYVMVKPVLEAFKRPVSAVFALVAIVGGAVLLKVTLNAMLGIDEPFNYEPGNIVPYSP